MQTELTLYDYWRIVNRRKWIALGVLGVTVLSTLVYTYLQSPVYQSQAIIKLQSQGQQARLAGFPGGDLDSRSAVATEIRVLTSAEIAERAGRRTGRLKFDAAGATDPEEVDALLAAYSAERLQDSNLISVTATDTDPRAASDLVAAVVEAYREFDLEQKSAQGRKNLEDLASRRTEVEENLRSLERSRQDFSEKHPRTGAGTALANQLADLQNKKKVLLEKYTPDHPEVLKLERQIRDTDQELAAMPSLELQLVRISRELRMQEELYTALNRQYEEAKLGLSSVVSAVSVVKPARPGTAPVSPDKPLNLLMGLILGGFLAVVVVFLLENLDVSINTIEEIESFLGLPVLGLICGVPAGDRVRDLLLPALRRGHAPAPAFRDALIVNRRHATSMIESFHSLRINILSHLKMKGGVSLVFSSAGAAEGKSLTAMNFSLAAAHAGLKTLLVDADIRRPVIYRVFGLDKQPGLSDVLTGRVDWQAALCESQDFSMNGNTLKPIRHFPGIERLKIINSGATHGNTVDYMDSFDWTALIGELKEEFDLVVFDTPPALLFVDPIVLARRADGVVLVYRAGRTARTALKRAVEQFRGAGARVLGVALNGVRASEMGPQYGYYYYDYKRYAARKK